MNLEEYEKFVKDKRLMSKIDAMAILENAKKQNDLIHSQDLRLEKWSGKVRILSQPEENRGKVWNTLIVTLIHAKTAVSGLIWKR